MSVTSKSAILIGNEQIQPLEPVSISIRNPAGGQLLCTLTGGGKADAVRAIEHASRSMPSWASQSVSIRGRTLHEIANTLREQNNLSDLSTLISTETGKRISEAEAEVNLSAAFFDWFGDVIATRKNETWQIVSGIRHEVYHQPIGIVGVITPWNFPVSIPARKIAAAIAAGCSIVFKPSEVAPSASIRFAELISSHLPPEVICTLIGNPPEIAQTLVDDPRIKAITFTGSTKVGQILAQEAATSMKRLILELGGSAPYIVLDDADIDQAVTTLMIAKYRNNGQSCIAANHAWIPKKFYDKFVDNFLEKTQDLVIGDPLDPSTTLGPLAMASDPQRISKLLSSAEETGTTVIRTHPGTLPDGNFVSPAVCLSPPTDSQIVQQEIFGPALSIIPYEAIDEIAEALQKIQYGLSGYISTNNFKRARDVAISLDIGIFGVNTATPNTPQIPFSGRKLSGIGYEGGQLGLNEFMKYQSIAYADN